MLAGIGTLGSVYPLEVRTLSHRAEPGHLAQTKEVLPKAMLQGTRCPVTCLFISGQCTLRPADSLGWRTDTTSCGKLEEMIFKISNSVFHFLMLLWVLKVQRCYEWWLFCPCNFLSQHRPPSMKHLTAQSHSWDSPSLLHHCGYQSLHCPSCCCLKSPGNGAHLGGVLS